MDEDYDAADLENWFMALQSADGSVIIPSFHRPGILQPSDWGPSPNFYPPSSVTSPHPSPMILRPRMIDGHDAASFPDLLPNSTTGQIPYDVDNDGDGISDAVWTDLGYPPQRDPNGKLYKPLFAFTVTGLNGKFPLNTAGNIQGRYQVDGPLPNAQSTIPAYYAGDPNYDHTSHLGYSCNEINPKYALQNAPGSAKVTTWLTPCIPMASPSC